MNSLTDLFSIARNSEAGEPSLEGQSEGSDSVFGQIFGLAQRGAEIYNGIQSAPETNAKAVTPPVIQKAQQSNNMLLIIGAVVVVLVLVLFASKK